VKRRMPSVTARFAAPVFLTALLCLALAGNALALDPIGKLTRVQGVVVSKQDVAGRAMAAGDPVHLGETLVTAGNARAEARLNDGSVVTLSEDTEFTFTRYDQKSRSVRFEMLKGAFRAVTGSMAKTAKPDFQVTTPLAVIGVRGTDFWGGFFSAEELAVFMVDGKGVFVRNAAGTSTIVRPGDGVTVRSAGKAPEAPVTWRQEKVAKAVRTVTFD